MCNDERVCECETFRDEYRNDDESSGRAGSSVRRRTIFFESHRATRVRWNEAGRSDVKNRQTVQEKKEDYAFFKLIRTR